MLENFFILDNNRQLIKNFVAFYDYYIKISAKVAESKLITTLSDYCHKYLTYLVRL